MAREISGLAPMAGAPKKRTRSAGALGNPRYPYTVAPGALKKFLEQIPAKPKPPKVNLPQLKGWDIKDNNAASIIRVLASVGVLTQDGAPTGLFEDLMRGEEGKKQLGEHIKVAYKELFEAEHEPYRDDATVTKLLNIHGGTEAAATIRRMRETFLILCRAADFSGPPRGSRRQPQSESFGDEPNEDDHAGGSSQDAPSIVINIQLTLPPGLDGNAYDAFFASMKKNLWPTK